MTARIEVSGELMDTPRAMTIGGDSVIWTAARVRMPAELAFPDRGASWRCFWWPVVVSVRSWPASARVTWCGCRGAWGWCRHKRATGHAARDSGARSIRSSRAARSIERRPWPALATRGGAIPFGCLSAGAAVRIREAGANVEKPTGAGWNKSASVSIRARRFQKIFQKISADCPVASGTTPGERAPRVVGGHPSIASNDSEFARAIRMIFSARSGILFLIFCLAGVSMQQCRVFLSRDADESA